jgi:hypothetical protein
MSLINQNRRINLKPSSVTLRSIFTVVIKYMKLVVTKRKVYAL